MSKNRSPSPAMKVTKRTYSRVKNAPSEVCLFLFILSCHLRIEIYFKASDDKAEDTQGHEESEGENPCTTSTPLKRSSHGEHSAAKRPLLIDLSPVKSLTDISFDCEPTELHDTTYDPSSDEKNLSADISMQGIKESFTPEEQAAATRMVLCKTSQLDKLLQRCQTCGAEIDERSKKKFATGALLTYEHTCQNKHIAKWRTSEIQNKIPLINVEITAAALCSGISYAELERFSQATDMACISRTTYDKHKSNYCYPIIKNEYWEMRKKVLEKIKLMTDLVFAGDGRFDSPGKNSAKYCHYSILEVTANLIVDFVIMQKNIERGEMESKAFKFVFQRVVDEVTEEKIRVFCSDRSLTVGRKMKDFFKTVNHAYDVRFFVRKIRKYLFYSRLHSMN